MVKVDLSIRECGGQVVVALRGELDVADAASVGAALVTVVSRGRALIADLADLRFMDCSGVAALVLVREQARRAGGDLVLAAPQQQVLRLLAAIHLMDALSVYPSVQKAALAVSGTLSRGAVPVS